MVATPVIQTRGLSKNFGPVRALQGLDLDISPGEIFGFIGPNGAGKTTTIRLLTGFLRPTSGQALVLGMDAWRDSVRIKRHLGFLPEAPGFYGNATGQDFLDYLASFYRGADPAVQRRQCDALDLGQEALRRPIRGYSRGMRQKLAVVQALQHRPRLLVMDEPTLGLDPLVQQSLFTLLRETRQEEGTTIFFSSHVLSEVERLCDRVGFIKDGQLVAAMVGGELRKTSVRHVEVRFAGEPPLKDLGLPQVISCQRDGRLWSLALQGDINPVLRALASWDLDDLIVEPAHLEDFFLKHYQAEEGE